MAAKCEPHGALPREQFVSEAIEPVGATFDTGRMARGEPGLPGEFIWRGRTVRIVKVLRSWKETGPCRNGSDEQYVRKHWYEVATASPLTPPSTRGREGSVRGVMKIYFERQPRGRHKTQRWWLFSLCEEPTGHEDQLERVAPQSLP
jgi:hypothetical protein